MQEPIRPIPKDTTKSECSLAVEVHGSRFVCEMFAVDLKAEPDDPRQDQRADEDDEDLHAPSALPGFFRGNFLFHAIAPLVGITARPR